MPKKTQLTPARGSKDAPSPKAKYIKIAIGSVTLIAGAVLIASQFTGGQDDTPRVATTPPPPELEAGQPAQSGGPNSSMAKPLQAGFTRDPERGGSRFAVPTGDAQSGK